jgi:hypothetical protein
MRGHDTSQTQAVEQCAADSDTRPRSQQQAPVRQGGIDSSDMYQTLMTNVRTPRSYVPSHTQARRIVPPSLTASHLQVGLDSSFDVAAFAKRYLEEGGFGVLMLVASTLLDKRYVDRTHVVVRRTAVQRLRIGTLGISGGRWLTGPLRDARRFPSTRL